MTPFLIASLLSIGLILVCSVMFYEIIAHVWVNLPRLDGKPRMQILLTVLAVFAAHTLIVWTFGAAYYLLCAYEGFGGLVGKIDTGDLLQDVYFSAVTYSSLGLGDVYPVDGLRLLVGIESILGLLLIGWSVTFTYLVTEKYLFHRRDPEA